MACSAADPVGATRAYAFPNAGRHLRRFGSGGVASVLERFAWARAKRSQGDAEDCLSGVASSAGKRRPRPSSDHTGNPP